MNGALSTFPIIANHPSPRLIEAVKTFEGFSPTVYEDGGGTKTWGYGFTQGTPPTEPMTEEEAEQILVGNLAESLQAVQTYFRLPLTPGQQDALTDFHYNEGPGEPGVKDGLVWLKEKDNFGRWQHSTLYTLLIRKNYADAANEFHKWVYVKGEEEEGLVKRAEIRRQWFTEYLTGKIYSFPYQWALLNGEKLPSDKITEPSAVTV